jgi:hypothetical protein
MIDKVAKPFTSTCFRANKAFAQRKKLQFIFAYKSLADAQSSTITKADLSIVGGMIYCGHASLRGRFLLDGYSRDIGVILAIVSYR